MTNILVRANLRSTFFQFLQGSSLSSFIILPLGTTVGAGDGPTHLALSPPLETVFVVVLPARSLAPDKLLIRLHIADADWAFALNGLANGSSGRGSRSLVVDEIWSSGNWSVGEY